MTKLHSLPFAGTPRVLRPLAVVVVAAVIVIAGTILGPRSAADAAVPSCTGDIVVPIGERLRADVDRQAIVELADPLDRGVYEVSAVSHDGYPERVGVVQPAEQWTVDLLDADGVSVLDRPAGPTTDLADSVAEASSVDRLGTVTVDRAVAAVRVEHVASVGPASVDAVCLGLDIVGRPGDGLSGSAGLVCADRRLSVAVANAGPFATRFRVVVDGAERASMQVGAGGTATTSVSVDVAGPAGRTVAVEIRSDDRSEPVLVTTVPIDCPSRPPVTTVPPGPAPPGPVPPPSTPDPSTPLPSPPPTPAPSSPPTPTPPRPLAAASVDCSAAEVGVALANPGGVAAEVDVYKVGDRVERGVRIDAGTTASVDFALRADDENGEVTVRVVHVLDGSRVLDVALPVDCLRATPPESAVVLDCGAAQVSVVVANVGGEPESITVFKVRDRSVDRILAPGQTETVRFDLGEADEDTAVGMRVLAAGHGVVLDEVVDVDCRQVAVPRADYRVACASAALEVDLANDGDAPTDFSVARSRSSAVENVRVEGGATERLVLDLAPADDAGLHLAVAADGVELIDETVGVDCVVPSASVDVSCASASLTLANAGAGPAHFEVELGLDSGAVAARVEVGVAPGERRAEPLPVPDGAHGTVLVREATAPDVLVRARVDRDCVRPAAALAVDCAAGGVLATLRAQGERPGRFLAFVDDEPTGDPVVVPAGGAVELPVPVVDGRFSLVRVIESSRVEPVAAEWVLVRCAGGGGTDRSGGHDGLQVRCVAGGLIVEITGPTDGYALRRGAVIDAFDDAGEVRLAALDGDRVQAEVLSDETVVERLDLVRDCAGLVAGKRLRFDDDGGAGGPLSVASVAALGIGALLAAAWIRRHEGGSGVTGTG